jgi:hypothetical protein
MPYKNVKNQRELILQLLDDVNLIEEHFSKNLLSPSAAKSFFAPILRRWIIDGEFYQVLLIIKPKEILFEITSDANAIKLCKAGIYEHWMNLIELNGVGISTSRLVPKYIEQPPENPMQDSRSPQKASIFFKQKVFFLKGKFYTREDVIKMLSNTLGGVHINFHKHESEQHINEIKNYFGLDWANPKNIRMLLGEEIEALREDVERRKSIYDSMELVTIDTARTFSKSVIASKGILLERLKELNDFK